jgi:hypothetical protein
LRVAGSVSPLALQATDFLFSVRIMRLNLLPVIMRRNMKLLH